MRVSVEWSARANRVNRQIGELMPAQTVMQLGADATDREQLLDEPFLLNFRETRRGRFGLRRTWVGRCSMASAPHWEARRGEGGDA